MIIRTPREQIIAYRQDESINQSSLKEIIKYGIQSFVANKERLLSGKDDQYEEKEHFVLGNGVDVKMCEDDELFLQDHHISTLERKPSDTLKAIAHMTFVIMTNSDLIPSGALEVDIDRSILYYALNNVQVKGEKGEIKTGYYMTRKGEDPASDKRIFDLLKDPVFMDYWRDIVRATGKQVLSVAEGNIIHSICTSFKTHPHTSYLFTDDPNIVTIYQLPLYFTVNGVRCKALLDKVDVNLLQKLIWPQDIKTFREETLLFPKAIRERKYHFQAAFYTRAIQECLMQISSLIGEDVMYFDILPFSFIVESTKTPGCPLVYDLSYELLLLGENGDDFNKGYLDAIREYDFWLRHDFDVEKAVHPTNGRLIVGNDFKHHLI